MTIKARLAMYTACSAAQLPIRQLYCMSTLQEIFLDDQITKLGVNIGGDVIKLGSDFGVQVGLSAT